MSPEQPIEHFDVVVVGAGLSGIGAGYHLQTNCPDQDPTSSWRVARASAAPGTCSATLAFAPTATCTRSATPSSHGRTQRPSPTVASFSTTCARPPKRTASTRRSASIRASFGRHGHRRTRSGPSRPSRAPRAPPRRFTCRFLLSCTGYYRYDAGYNPDIPGMRRFQGQTVHPQKWTCRYRLCRISASSSSAAAPPP